MDEPMVLGERCTDIADELVGMKLKPRMGGGVSGTVRMRSDGPLVRAIFRAEAELLCADAAAMASGTYAQRTPEQRRADALVEVATRVGDAVRVTGGAPRDGLPESPLRTT